MEGLDGTTVVVLGGSLAATLCGVILREFGADVVKVEPPEGDPLRQVGPFVDGVPLRWAATARGLKSVTCDLRSPRGRILVDRLLNRADVVCDGTGGAGLGSGVLNELDRRPVLVRFTAVAGRDGTESSLGDGLLAAAAGGLLHVTGYPDGPPLRLGADVVDHLAASYAAQAAMAALLRWRATGKPCVIDAPLSGAALRILEWAVAAYDTDDTVRTREGNFPTAVAPIGLYPAADGQLVGIVGASDANFTRLTTTMGRPDLLGDPRFATGELRAKNSGAVNQVVADWVSSRSGAEVLQICRKGGVIVGLVRGISEVLADEHVRARGDIVVVDDPLLGPLPVPAAQPHSPHHRTAGEPAPVLGADDVAVWRNQVGLDPVEFDTLVVDGIILEGR